MKNFTKTLVAATLALGTVSANAAIDNTGSFDSEAFLSVYDAASKGTFTLDLGVNLSTLVANLNNASFALSYDLSPLADWNSFKAAAGVLNDAVYSVTAGGRDAGFNPYVLSTGNNQFATGVDWNALDSMQGQINGHALNINTDAGDIALFSNNNSTFVVDGDGKLGHHGSAIGLWGSPTDHNPNIAYGDSGDFQLTKMNAAFTASEAFTFAGGWRLAGDELTLNAVPVPAAVWLFGTALLGMAGIKRRNVTAA